MMIVLYTGEVIFCDEIEFGKDNMLMDGHIVVPIKEVIRIINRKEE